MAVGRVARRKLREAGVVGLFGEERAPAALDLLELLELAWHDVYGEVSPSDEIIEDVLVLSEGSIDELARAARLAVIDWRDLRVAADERRRSV